MVNVIPVSEIIIVNLQSLAKEYGVDHIHFGHIKEPRYEVDNSSTQ